MRAVHGVRDWRTFGMRFLPFSGGKLDTIQQQHSSLNDRITALVQEWFTGHQQSWRQVIYSLDCVGEYVLADLIRGYAEPPPGEWSDNCCVTRDLLIVSYPTPPISVEGVVSVAQMSSEFQRKQSLQLMLPFGLFMQYRFIY